MYAYTKYVMEDLANELSNLYRFLILNIKGLESYSKQHMHVNLLAIC